MVDKLVTAKLTQSVLLIGCLLWGLFVSSMALAQSVSVSDARIRLPLPGQSVAVLYFTVENLQATERVINSVEVEGADRAELHRHLHENGMMKMRKIDSVALDAGESLQFRPHGHHVMVYGLRAEQAPVPVTLLLRNGERIEFTANVVRF